MDTAQQVDVVTALSDTYERFAELVSALSTDDMTKPTPCSEFDVRALVNHAVGTTWLFALANQGRLDELDGGDVLGDDPSGAIAEAVKVSLASWRADGGLQGERALSFGTFSASECLMLNLSDIAVHNWDLATATGQSYTMDDALATLLLEYSRTMPLDQKREYGVFGPQVDVPDDASDQDKLLALLGRQP